MTHSARLAAHQAISRVFEQGLTLDESLESVLAKSKGLEPRDRSFCINLSFTFFRELGAIDYVVSQHLIKPLPKTAEWARTWLRLGVAQLLFLRVPDHAAVSETVSAVGEHMHPSAKTYKNLVNAVLRAVAKKKEQHVEIIKNRPELSLPSWLWTRWRKNYGNQAAQEIARVHHNPPPLHICLKKEDLVLIEKLSAKKIFKNIYCLTSRGRIEELPGFYDGVWWVQDVAASLPSLLFGSVEGKHVLDICAAPGGKTLSLATQGALVTALDLSKLRLKLLEENLNRTKLKAEIVAADILTYEFTKLFEGVLLDAPCSSTGTLRRHPDIAYLKTEKDILRLATLQKKLIKKAFSNVKTGGLLIYCVCSLEPEEGEEIVRDFLKQESTAKLIPITSQELDCDSHWITSEGFLRTLPCYLSEQGGMDGFFAARLLRQSS